MQSAGCILGMTSYFIGLDTSVSEALLVAVVLLLGFCGFRFSGRRCSRLRRLWSRSGNRRGLSIVLVGGITLVGCVAISLAVGLPLPERQDEFSYLLAADTYAHGRLTNPTHPMWVHFETIHVIHQPTYMSKYPAGQGLALAFGQALFGQPVVGMWVCLTLAAMATCWMLQAWLPPRWALLGGLLVALHPRLLIDWGNSYWGGAVAMLGGALMFGALRRLLRQPTMRVSLLLGIGLALLALTRPFEGLLASIPVAIALLVGLVRRGGAANWVRALLLTSVVGVLALAFLLYYNSRVTGDPLRLPYLVHEETYSVAPLNIWQQPRYHLTYRHAAIQEFQTGWCMHFYYLHFPLTNLLRAYGDKLGTIGRFYFQVVLLVPWLALTWRSRDRWVRFALLDIALTLAGEFQVSFLMPHYAAPLTGLLFFVVVAGLRQLRVAARWRPRLQPLMPGLLVIFLVSSAIFLVESLAAGADEWCRARAGLLQRLEHDGSKHLVVVRYREGHDTLQEWVYNAADIDRAPVVWARDMGAAGNQDLLAYFRDRQVWLVEVDGRPAELTPYPTPAVPGPTHVPDG